MTKVPLDRYVTNLLQHKEGSVSLDFPIVEIFDQNGKQRFHSQGKVFSRSALKRLIANRAKLAGVDGAPDLTSAIHAIGNGKDSLPQTSDRRYVLMILGTPECSSCLQQEATLQSVRHTLDRSHVDALVVELSN
jgi:hypothetical protein